MNTSQLDFYFPFFLFFYGVLMLFMMQLPAYLKVREQIRHGFASRFHFAFPVSNFSENALLVMVFVGALWSLQNLVLG